MRARVGVLAAWLASAGAVAVADEPKPGAQKPGDQAAAPVAGPPSPRDADALVKKVFEREYPFCHDPQYALTGDELTWCALVPGGGKEPDPRCPQLAEACKRGEKARVVIRPRRRLTGSDEKLPTIPGPIAWALLGLAVAVVVVRLVRQSVVQAPPSEARAPEEEAAVEDAPRARARAIETDVQRLLERARAAAAAGDFAGGLGDAYAAWLRKLEGEGVVRVETGRTNGDHLREVGRKLPAARQPMREVVTVVERVQFGGEAPDESHFQFVYDGVVRLLGQSFQAAVAVLLFAGLLVGAGACMPSRGDWNESPSGRAAVVALLSQGGFEVKERVLSLTRIGETVQQLVLLPEIAVDKEDWKALDRWVGGGGTLIVAGGERELPPWIPVTFAAGSAKVSAPLTVGEDPSGRVGRGEGVVPGGTALKVPAVMARGTETKDGDGDHGPWALLVRGKEIYGAEETHGAGKVVVLADDRLFQNASLLARGNAALVLAMLGVGGRRVELADDVTGLVSTDPLTSVSHGRLAPAMLQLALLALLFFGYKGLHFGRPTDPLQARRRAFAEHARAMGARYGQARAARHALGLYGAYALERLRERLHLAGGRSLGAVAEAVAARTGRPLGDVMRVLLEGRAEAGAPEPSSREAAAAALATMRELATLLNETGGSR